jgi:sugar phosphate isomerase/epimerase
MQETEHGIRNKRSLCLSTSRSPTAEIDHELEIAGQAGFSCVELWAPALHAYLARHPPVWLDVQLRQHGIRTLVLNGLDPLPIMDVEDALVNQAHFLELCTHLDALGGATIVLHPAEKQGKNKQRLPGFEHTLRAYADLAAPFEVLLAFEFRANGIVPDLGTAQDLVQRGARSNLRLALSTREWQISAGDPQALDALKSDLLALVHLDSLPDEQPQASAKSTQPPTRDDPGLSPDVYARLSAAGFGGPYCLLPASGPGTPLECARAARELACRTLQASP